jgi:hypothetical protein
MEPGKYAADVRTKNWQAFAETPVPGIGVALASAIPVGSFATVPGPGASEVSAPSLASLTPEMHGRLLASHEKLPAPPPSKEIKPIPIPLPQGQPKPGGNVVRSANMQVPKSLRIYVSQPTTSAVQVDTLLWHPILFAENGSATLSFGFAGNITSYGVLLYGSSPSGRLGVFQGQVQVRP